MAEKDLIMEFLDKILIAKTMPTNPFFMEPIAQLQQFVTNFVEKFTTDKHSNVNEMEIRDLMEKFNAAKIPLTKNDFLSFVRSMREPDRGQYLVSFACMKIYRSFEPKTKDNITSYLEEVFYLWSGLQQNGEEAEKEAMKHCILPEIVTSLRRLEDGLPVIHGQALRDTYFSLICKIVEVVKTMKLEKEFSE